jgi:hypothetical protein
MIHRLNVAAARLRLPRISPVRLLVRLAVIGIVLGAASIGWAFFTGTAGTSAPFGIGTIDAQASACSSWSASASTLAPGSLATASVDDSGCPFALTLGIPRGDVGATGPAGPAGPAGADSTVPGPTGPAGPAGPAGANGVSVTATAEPVGINCTAPGGGSRFVVGATGTPVFACNGATGAQGIQGPKGDQGIQGQTGATGSTGPVGPQGPAGTNGVSGYEIKTATSASGASGSVTTPACSTGKKVIGGGARIDGSFASGRIMYESFPDTTAQTWKASFAGGSGTTTITAWAICAVMS